MGKQKNISKSKKRMVIICIFAAVLLTAAAILAVRFLWHKSTPYSAGESTDISVGKNSESDLNETGSNETNSRVTDIELDEESFTPVVLNSSVEVTGLGRFAGMYVEDGSDEIVNGTAVAIVENIGEENIQYMTFSITDINGTKYEFELTTLLPGERMTVLDKNRTPYGASPKIESFEVTGLALFTEEPSLHTDKIMLSCDENAITVKNISTETLPEGRVFYKNLSGELLIGGITYMVSFPELAPDESITLTPTHFTDGSSRIMFVTYAG